MVTLTQEEFQVLGLDERKSHLAEEEKIVFGHNFQRDRTGHRLNRASVRPGISRSIVWQQYGSGRAKRPIKQRWRKSGRKIENTPSGST